MGAKPASHAALAPIKLGVLFGCDGFSLLLLTVMVNGGMDWEGKWVQVHSGALV
jgi:hypothetical protein